MKTYERRGKEENEWKERQGGKSMMEKAGVKINESIIKQKNNKNKAGTNGRKDSNENE